jgi:hypothetical protein
MQSSFVSQSIIDDMLATERADPTAMNTICIHVDDMRQILATRIPSGQDLPVKAKVKRATSKRASVALAETK